MGWHMYTIILGDQVKFAKFVFAVSSHAAIIYFGGLALIVRIRVSLFVLSLGLVSCYGWTTTPNLILILP